MSGDVVGAEMNPEDDFSLGEPELRGELARLRDDSFSMAEVRISLVAFAVWLGVGGPGEQAVLVDRFIEETT